MTKVILIEPNKPPRLFEYNEKTKKEIFGNSDTDGFALRAPESENMLLAMIGHNISDNMEPNHLATTFASYLRRYYRYQENIVKGNIIIIDDNGDMDINKYKILKEMTENKKRDNHKGCNNHLYPKVPNETVDYMIDIPDEYKNIIKLPPGLKIKKFKPPILPGATALYL